MWQTLCHSSHLQSSLLCYKLCNYKRQQIADIVTYPCKGIRAVHTKNNKYIDKSVSIHTAPDVSAAYQ